jgi:predicted TIM-barrel fold metal-dependent hydrolase
MATLAACPNAAVKISGLGQPASRWTAAANREFVLRTIDLFGVERCMFSSNFPVDGLCAGFAEVIGGYRDIVADFSEGDRRRLFHDNAVAHYAIDGLLPQRAGDR